MDMYKYKIWLHSNVTKDAPPGCGLKVGDVVTFTNDYGVQFTDRKVIGFAKPGEYLNGRFIHIDTDSYWFPHRPEELRKQ